MDNVTFRLRSQAGALMVLNEVVNWELSPIFCDAGAISIEYTANTNMAAHIIAQLDLDRIVELQTFVDGVRAPKLDVFIEDYDGSLLEDNQTWRFTGRTAMGLLEFGIIGPRGPRGTDAAAIWSVAEGTPGTYASIILNDAKGRGALSDIIVGGWTIDHDSNSAPWAQQVSMEIAVGTTMLDVLRTLRDLEMLEFEIINKVLYLYNPGTMGVDRSNDVLITQGRDIIDSPRKKTTRGMTTGLLAVGTDGQFAWNNDNSAASRIGRRRESVFSAGSISTFFTLNAAGQAKLAQLSIGKMEHTVGVALDDPETPVPGYDFNVGDWVLSRTSIRQPSPERLRVKAWMWKGDTDSITATVTMNDFFAEREQQLSQRIDALTSGSTMAGSGPAKPSPVVPGDLTDNMPPAQPDNLTITSIAYHDENNNPKSLVRSDWPEVRRNQDGSTATDVTGYEFQWATADFAFVPPPKPAAPQPVPELLIKRPDMFFYNWEPVWGAVMFSQDVAGLYAATSSMAADYGLNILFGDQPGYAEGVKGVEGKEPYWLPDAEDVKFANLRMSCANLVKQLAKFPITMIKNRTALENIRLVGSIRVESTGRMQGGFAVGGAVFMDGKELWLSAADNSDFPGSSDEPPSNAQDNFAHTVTHELAHVYHLTPDNWARWHSAGFNQRWNDSNAGKMPYGSEPWFYDETVPGYITGYANTNLPEDFAEVWSFATTSILQYDKLMARYQSDNTIRAKVDLLNEFIAFHNPEAASAPLPPLRIERGTRDVKDALPRQTWEELGSTTNNWAEISAIPPGTWIKGRVRAVDRSGNRGAWRESIMHKTAEDDTPPNQPSAPDITEYLGVLIIKWNGKDLNGVNMVRDFEKVEVHVSTVNNFTPSAETLVDTLPGNGPGTSAFADGEIGTTYYFRLLAYDFTGNVSQVSGQGSATPGLVVVDSIEDEIIEAKHIAADAVTAGKIAAGAIDDETILADQVIGTAKIRNLAVGTAQIATAAINTAKIADLAVGSAKMGDLAVVNAKIGWGEITNAKIQDAAIQSGKIGNLAVGKLVSGIMSAAVVLSGQFKTSDSETDYAVMNPGGVYVYRGGQVWARMSSRVEGNYFRGDITAQTFRSTGFSTAGRGYIEMGNTGPVDPVDEVRFFYGSFKASIRSPSAFPGSIRLSMNEGTVVDFRENRIEIPDNYPIVNQGTQSGSSRNHNYIKFAGNGIEFSMYGPEVFTGRRLDIFTVESNANIFMRCDTSIGAALKFIAAYAEVQVFNAGNNALGNLRANNVYADNIASTSDPSLKRNIVELNIDALELLRPQKMHAWDWDPASGRSGSGIGMLLTEIPAIADMSLRGDDEDFNQDPNTYSMSTHMAIQTQAINQLAEENRQLRDILSDLQGKIEGLLNNQTEG